MKRLATLISAGLLILSVISLVIIIFKPNESFEDKTEQIYATDITVNTEFRALNIFIENKIKFSKSPYIIKPENYNMGVELKMHNYLSKDRNDGSFVDNSFSASAKGAFYLKFYVKTKYETKKYDTLKISVKEKANEARQSIVLSPKATSISNNEVLDVADYVLVNGFEKEKLKYHCSKGMMKGSIFVPDGIGSYDIEVIIDNGDYLIFDVFTVKVSNDNKQLILLYDVNNNLVKEGEVLKFNKIDKVVLFSYIVEGMVNQVIKVEIKNDKVVSLISSDAPIIVLELASVGEAEVILKIPNTIFEFKFVVLVE